MLRWRRSRREEAPSVLLLEGSSVDGAAMFSVCPVDDSVDRTAIADSFKNTFN